MKPGYHGSTAAKFCNVSPLFLGDSRLSLSFVITLFFLLLVVLNLVGVFEIHAPLSDVFTIVVNIFLLHGVHGYISVLVFARSTEVSAALCSRFGSDRGTIFFLISFIALMTLLIYLFFFDQHSQVGQSLRVLVPLVGVWHIVHQMKGLHLLRSRSQESQPQVWVGKFFAATVMLFFFIFLLMPTWPIAAQHKSEIFRAYQITMGLGLLIGVCDLAINRKFSMQLMESYSKFAFLGFIFASPIAMLALRGIHGVESYEVLSRIHRHSKNRNVGAYVSVLMVALIGYSILITTIYVYSKVPESKGLRFLFSLGFGMALAHYLVEHLLFRFRHKQNRDYVLPLLGREKV